MRPNKKVTILIYLFSFSILFYRGLYAQVSEEYEPNYLYDGAQVLKTSKMKYDSKDEEDDQYIWVDGQETISSVPCWRIFEAYNDFVVDG